METHNPEIELTLILNLNYQKILILLGQSIHYPAVVTAVMKKMMENETSTDKLESRLYHLVSIVNCISEVDIDELAVQALIGK